MRGRIDNNDRPAIILPPHCRKITHQSRPGIIAVAIECNPGNHRGEITIAKKLASGQIRAESFLQHYSGKIQTRFAAPQERSAEG